MSARPDENTGRLVLVTRDDLAQRRARLEILLGRMRTKRDRDTVWALLVLQRENEAAFDAAPADPVAALLACRDLDFCDDPRCPPCRNLARAVLVALGANEPRAVMDEACPHCDYGLPNPCTCPPSGRSTGNES